MYTSYITHAQVDANIVMIIDTLVARAFSSIVVKKYCLGRF